MESAQTGDGRFSKLISTFDPSELFKIEAKDQLYETCHIQPRHLSQNLKDLLLKNVYPVAQEAFDQPDSPGFKKDVEKHVIDVPDLLVIMENRKPVAFIVWETFDSKNGKVIYLSGLCVKKDYLGKRIGSAMSTYVEEFSSQLFPEWKYMSMRTQNSVMQKTFKSFANSGTVYQFGDTDIPEDVQEVVLEVASRIKDDKIDPKRLISKGAYGSTLYGDGYEVGYKNIGTSLEEIDQKAGDATYSVWKR